MLLLHLQSSFGFGIAILIPVFRPGATISGFTSKYLMIALVSECIIFGTTDDTTTLSIFASGEFISSHCLRNTPYSSEVRDV